MATDTSTAAPARTEPVAVHGVPAKARKLPAGAAAWTRLYLNEQGLPVESKHLVPVDGNERRTHHLRCRCPHTERVKDATKTNMARVRCPVEYWIEPDQSPPFCSQHGRQTEADGKANAPDRQLVPWGLLGQSVREPARALWALAAEAVAGAVARGEHMPAYWSVAAAAALAGAGYVAVRAKLTRKEYDKNKGQIPRHTWRLIRRRARLAAYIGAASGLWLGLASLVDPFSIAGWLSWFVALPIAWAVGSQPYRRYLATCHKPEPEQVEKVEEKSTEEPAEIDPRAAADAQAWAESVAPDSQSLKSTYVDTATWRPDTGGRRMVIRAKRGGITDAQLTAALPLISAALDVPKSSIGWVEEHEGSTKSALLLVQPNSPLNEPIPGKPVGLLDVTNATAHMGMKIDSTDLTTRLFIPGRGAPSRLMIGLKDSGKSGLVRRLLTVMLQAQILNDKGQPTRLVAPFLHDPKLGFDYGAYRRLVEGFSTGLEHLDMIVEALIREMNRRYSMVANTVWYDEKGRKREGERPFDPTIHGPVISLVIDEFHEVAADKGLIGKLSPFTRKMRAAGIEVCAATHQATYGDTGDGVIRDMLAGGETYLLRTTSALNAALAAGGQVVGDPRALPRIPGMLLQVAGEGPSMQARAAFNNAEELYDMLHDDNNNPRILPVEWPQETLDAFGPDFVAWMRASQSRELGTEVPPVPTGVKKLAAEAAAKANGGRNLKAEEVLRLILFQAGRPMKRENITRHPEWTGRNFNEIATFNAAAKAGIDAGWLIRISHGVYDLAPGMRQQMAEAQREEENAA